MNRSSPQGISSSPSIAGRGRVRPFQAFQSTPAAIAGISAMPVGRVIAASRPQRPHRTYRPFRYSWNAAAVVSRKSPSE